MPTIREVSERKFIDIRDAGCHTVALYWLNKNSGWDMFCFAGTQTEGIEVGAGEEFERFIADLADVIGRSKYISKTEIPKIVLGYSGLETDKVRGVKTILSAIEVLMLTSGKDVLPPTFTSVKVVPGSFSIIETENNYHNLEFMIELPELFNQEQ